MHVQYVTQNGLPITNPDLAAIDPDVLRPGVTLEVGHYRGHYAVYSVHRTSNPIKVVLGHVTLPTTPDGALQVLADTLRLYPPFENAVVSVARRGLWICDRVGSTRVARVPLEVKAISGGVSITIKSGGEVHRMDYDGPGDQSANIHLVSASRLRDAANEAFARKLLRK